MLELIRCDPNTTAADIVSNTAAETLFTNTYSKPADNFLTDNSARFFDIEAHGAISTLASASGSLTIKLKWGSTVIGTATIPTLPTSLVSAGWNFRGKVRLAVTGTSGLVAGFGTFEILSAGAVVAGDEMTHAGTGQTGYVTVNTQLAAQIGLSATFGTASASNAIQCNDLEICEKR